MTVQITDAQEQELSTIASQAGVSVDKQTQRAVDHYLTWRKDFVAAVKVGLGEADRGELVDHEEVIKMLDDIIENG
jgi:predicted transcriptional regulator